MTLASKMFPKVTGVLLAQCCHKALKFCYISKTQ